MVSHTPPATLAIISGTCVTSSEQPPSLLCAHICDVTAGLQKTTGSVLLVLRAICKIQPLGWRITAAECSLASLGFGEV
jgi:hypothetical protein